MFEALFGTKKKKSKAKSRSGNVGSLVNSRLRACAYDQTQRLWICTLANGRRLVLSGQSLIKLALAANSPSVKSATLAYPPNGLGGCKLTIVFNNGRPTKKASGTCALVPKPKTVTANPGPRPLGAAQGAPQRALPVRRPREAPVPSGPTPAPSAAPQCCCDAESNTLICEDETSPFHGAPVTLAELHEGQGPNGSDLVTVYVNGDPQRGMRVPLCVTLPVPTGPTPPTPAIPTGPTPPTPAIPTGPTPGPSTSGCCYDPMSSTLVCGDQADPLHGAPVTLAELHEGKGPGGIDLATVYVNGDPTQGMRVPLCVEQPPIQCCLDLATSTLICSDPSSALHGLVVSVSDLGDDVARVAHDRLRGGFLTVPLCQVPPQETIDCCFNQDTMQVVCPDTGNPLHGRTAGIVAEFQYPNGAPGVSISWPGGTARMPLCGRRPPAECPPSYCCVNLDTFTFVCPGMSALHGQRADVVDIQEQGGFNYAVLSDGTFVPVCGKDCPPPQLCPDGYWRSPAGDCVEQPCPTCPPGYLLDTQTGQCVEMPTCPECPGLGQTPECPPGHLLDPATGLCVPPSTCPEPPPCPTGDCPPCPPCGGPTWPQITPCCDQEPWWKKAGHCCESCALGKPCEGECGCGGDHDHGQGSAAAPAWTRPASFFANRV